MKYRHLSFIESKLKNEVKKLGSVKVGNNLNEYISFKEAENYVNELKKKGDDRVGKSSKDVLLGRLVEEIIVYLLKNYFIENKLNYIVSNETEDQNLKEYFDSFNIKHIRFDYEKKFDVDILIKKEENNEKFFILSSKGTSRERIGQYLSNLFLMDNRVVRTKYEEKYKLEFYKKNLYIKYGFICMDWAKSKDFTKYSPKGKLRKTLKQTEVQLINDDLYIGGGVTILNNLDNLNGVMNFSELVGKITSFLN